MHCSTYTRNTDINGTRFWLRQNPQCNKGKSQTDGAPLGRQDAGCDGPMRASGEGRRSAPDCGVARGQWALLQSCGQFCACSKNVFHPYQERRQRVPEVKAEDDTGTHDRVQRKQLLACVWEGDYGGGAAGQEMRLHPDCEGSYRKPLTWSCILHTRGSQQKSAGFFTLRGNSHNLKTIILK